MRIVVDVASDRLGDELVELLERAGHALVRGSAATCTAFDLALVGTPELAERVKRERPHAAVIVVTKLGDVPARVRALEVGADDAFDAGFPQLPAMHRHELEHPVTARRAPRPRSLEASLLAPGKHMVEAPLLRAVTVDVDYDTMTNLELHAQVHQLLATGVEWTTEQIVDWLYRELFLMPPDDPYLGLDVPDPF